MKIRDQIMKLQTERRCRLADMRQSSDWFFIPLLPQASFDFRIANIENADTDMDILEHFLT